jgi:hypothetical protein
VLAAGGLLTVAIALSVAFFEREVLRLRATHLSTRDAGETEHAAA